MSEIHKVLVLSNAHVTQEDMDLLAEHSDVPTAPLFCAADPYGGWVYVPKDASGLDEAREKGYSDSMGKVLLFAKDKDCRYVKLDRDGSVEESEALDVHEW
jgi:hypothetical protein